MTSRSQVLRLAALLVAALFPGRAMPAIAQDVAPWRPEGPVVRVTIGLV